MPRRSALRLANFATWSFSLIKGVNTVQTAGLLSTGDVADFAESFYVAITVNNCWGRHSQYDAPAVLVFVLVA